LLISSILVVCNLGENKPVIFFEGGGMTPEEIEKIAIPRLTTQFERALPILFTGAGFPLQAKNLAGEDVPTYDGLKNKLWNLCFPGEPVEPDTSLQQPF